MDSILTSIKKLLGLAESYEHFDTDIIMHINSVFMALNQMGIGPETCFSIQDKSSYWSDFTSNDKMLEPVKSYMYFKVRLMFDPPASSAVIEAINKNISELEWRLYSYSEFKEES